MSSQGATPCHNINIKADILISPIKGGSTLIAVSQFLAEVQSYRLWLALFMLHIFPFYRVQKYKYVQAASHLGCSHMLRVSTRSML